MREYRLAARHIHAHPEGSRVENQVNIGKQSLLDYDPGGRSGDTRFERGDDVGSDIPHLDPHEQLVADFDVAVEQRTRQIFIVQR